MTQETYRPRRSCLYMPASNARALEKAKTLPADTIIFDLEDAVAPEAKKDARDQACAAIASGAYGSRELVVRVNGMDTPWFAEDMTQICGSGANAILVPKIVDAKNIVELTDFMENENTHIEMKLWAMIEMPLAILNIAEIAAMALQNRLSTFVMGFNDLAKEMRAEQDRTLFTPAMAQTIMAARAYDMTVLDSVYNDFNDPAGLEAECEQGRKYGFDGKTLIHPSQIEIANRVFAPSEGKIAEARAIVAAFADPANAGKGVLTVEGKMTEVLHLRQAEQTLALASAIAARASI
ncbi:CoA ester lyase [Parasphingorhabdus sp.]|uniref:HpcH/HpaI aldolase/citrate lyase family protein n=1 Tax=Parasphingorhabdus sp. TaxID=2709688 RepID=UPI0032672619